MIVKQSQIGDLHQFLPDGHFPDGRVSQQKDQLHVAFLSVAGSKSVSVLLSASRRQRAPMGRMPMGSAWPKLTL